jgi:hypothetical protein
MPITHLMSEICNLAYLIVENAVKEQYNRHRRGTGESRRRKTPQRSHRSPDTFKNATRPPVHTQRP